MEVMKEIALCPDCVFPAVNDDYTGLDYWYGPEESAEREKEIRAGLARLGWIAHAGREPEEFSKEPCDCCGTKLAGERERFVVLG